jgi:hypothetical protein
VPGLAMGGKERQIFGFVNIEGEAWQTANFNRELMCRREVEMTLKTIVPKR